MRAYTLLVRRKEPYSREPCRKGNLSVFINGAHQDGKFAVTGLFVTALELLTICQPVNLLTPAMGASRGAIPKLQLQIIEASLFI